MIPRYSNGQIVDARLTASKPLEQPMHHIEVTVDGTYKIWTSQGVRNKVMKAGVEYDAYGVIKITKPDDEPLDAGVCYIVV